MSAIFKEGFSFSGFERDLLALNLGDGSYLDISGVSGVDSISDGRGSVFADFDNDGDLDILLTTAQGEAHVLFRNEVGSANGFLRVDLVGARSGRDAYGAVVRVATPSGVRTKLKAGGSGFLSQSDPRLLFGLGPAERAEWIEVVWPDGTTQRVAGAPAGASVRIVQGASGPEAVAERRFSLVDPLGREERLFASLGFAKAAPFPNLRLASLDGKARALSEVRSEGRRTLLNFWATWCVPCAQEMPELERLRPALERARIDLVGVSLDTEETVAKVPAVVESRGVRYPIYTTGEDTLEALYPRGEAVVPLSVLLDEYGRVLEVYSGWNERSERGLEALARGR